MKYKKLTSTIEEARKQENNAAKIEQQAALIEYVAIMADIELPTAESEGMGDE